MTHYVFLLKEWEMGEQEQTALEGLLPQREQEKLRAKGSRGRRQSLLGRLLMYFAVWQVLGKTAAIEYTAKGKPVVSPAPDERELFIGCTHTEGLIGAAAGFAPLGLDGEKIGPCRHRVAKRLFAPEEQEAIAHSENPGEAFTLFWALRESLGKMTGDGVLGAPAAVFSLPSPLESPLEGSPSLCGRGDVFSAAWTEQGKWAVALSAGTPGQVSRRWVSREELLLWLQRERPEKGLQQK